MGQMLGYTYRIKNLTEEQKQYIDKSIACARAVHNKLVKLYLDRMEKATSLSDEEKKEIYKNRIKYSDAFKDENLEWTKWCASSILEYEERFVKDAFDKWYKLLKFKKSNSELFSKKYGEEALKNPNFGKPKINKYRDKNSITLRNRACVLNENRLILPLFKKLDIKPLQLVLHRPFNGKIQKYTIIREDGGSAYYVSICVELEDNIEPLPKVNKAISIDVGIKKHITYLTSDGKTGVIENLRIYKNLQDRIAFYNKELSRRVFGSNRWKQTKLKLGKLYARQKHIRKNFLDNETKNIINNYDIIIIEDIKVKEVIAKTNKETFNKCKKKRQNINKATYDVAWYEFRRMLEYKSKLYGRDLIIVDKNFKSTQLCHVCGNINKSLNDVNIREWVCDKCHTHHDRDINACYNLMNYANIKIVE